MNNFDLHFHSDYSSDGELKPVELIQMAKKKGLTTVALSDHDCMSGIDEMIQLGKQYDITVIPAIEFSTRFNNDFECHLLGYNLDYKQEYFMTIGKHLEDVQNNAFYTRVDKLNTYYHIDLNAEMFIKEANGKNPWFNLCNYMFSTYPEIEDFKDIYQVEKDVILLL